MLVVVIKYGDNGVTIGDSGRSGKASTEILDSPKSHFPGTFYPFTSNERHHFHIRKDNSFILQQHNFFFLPVFISMV